MYANSCYLKYSRGKILKTFTVVWKICYLPETFACLSHILYELRESVVVPITFCKRKNKSHGKTFDLFVSYNVIPYDIM